MVVDSSAIVAIVLGEPEREAFLALLTAQAPLSMSAVTLHESSIVTAGKKADPVAIRFVDGLIQQYAIEIVPVDIDGAVDAREAYFRFGRGWHDARLNLADCFSYSLAKTRGEPLLFKGDDFLKTDIVPAWRP
jgi:ribonuclease VapC